MNASALVRRATPVAIAVAALAVFSIGTAAQETLKYVTTDEGSVVIDSPMGVMEVDAEGYSEVVFEIDGESIRVTHDSIFSYVGGPMGDQSPDVSAIRDGEFELALDRPGVVRTVSHPPVEVGTAGDMDPLHMFDDFFIPLPDEPISVGLEWSDQLTHDGSSQPDGTYLNERTINLKAVRDTVVGGRDAFVVEVSQTLSTQSSGVSEQQGFAFDFDSTSDGTETGMAIITADGVMLYRERSIDLGGLFTIFVQGQVMDMTQSMSFQSTQTLVNDN